MKCEACNQAVAHVFGKIKLGKIEKFIDEIECMSKIRKRFYRELIRRRYEIMSTLKLV